MASVVTACSGGGRSVEVGPGVTPEPTRTPTPVPTLELEPGWHTFDAGPLEGRIGAAAVWTGAEVLVWGGTDASGTAFRNGAAFDPSTGRWRELPLAPPPARAFSVAVWTGAEMVVVGGVDGDDRVLTGAVAYDPAEDSWRELDVAWGAVNPLADAVWTGERVVVVGAIPPPTGDPLADMVSIDVDLGFLDVLATFGAPDRRGLWAGWTGSTIVTATVTDGQPVLIRRHDPATGGVVGDPLDSGVLGLDVVADQIGLLDGVVVVPSATAGGVVDLGTGRATSLPVPASRSRWPAAVVGEVLSLGEVALDPSTGSWSATPIDPDWARDSPMVVATDDRIVVWGGDACGRTASCEALVPATETLVWVPE